MYSPKELLLHTAGAYLLCSCLGYYASSCNKGLSILTGFNLTGTLSNAPIKRTAYGPFPVKVAKVLCFNEDIK